MARPFRLVLVCALAIVALACAASSSAALDRYASPTGSGDCTTAATACSLKTAVDSTPGIATVHVAPGTYGSALTPIENLGSDSTFGGLQLRALDPANRPKIFISQNIAAPGSHPAAFFNSTATLADLDFVVVGPAFYGVNVQSGTISRVTVTGTASTYLCVQPSVIDNSVCSNTLDGGTSLGASVAAASSGPTFVGSYSVTNVTAWSTGAGGIGVQLFAGVGADIDLTLKNVIAHGSGSDVNTVCDSTAGANGSRSDIFLSNSNFSNRAQNCVGGSISDAAASGNQAAPPALNNPAGGDFREAATSPTVDAGSDAAIVGSQDVIGGPRVVGSHVDIGGYETGPPPSSPAGPDLAAPPKLLYLKLARTRFRANPYSASGSLSTKSPQPAKYKSYGTTVNVKTDAKATMHFTLQQSLPKTKGGKKKFSWKSKVGEVTVAILKSGGTKIYVSGRWKGKALAPGRYRLVGTITRPGDPLPLVTGNQPFVQRSATFSIRE
jgi:hypothetical protein